MWGCLQPGCALPYLRGLNTNTLHNEGQEGKRDRQAGPGTAAPRLRLPLPKLLLAGHSRGWDGVYGMGMPPACLLLRPHEHHRPVPPRTCLVLVIALAELLGVPVSAHMGLLCAPGRGERGSRGTPACILEETQAVAGVRLLQSC